MTLLSDLIVSCLVLCAVLLVSSAKASSIEPPLQNCKSKSSGFFPVFESPSSDKIECFNSGIFNIYTTNNSFAVLKDGFLSYGSFEDGASPTPFTFENGSLGIFVPPSSTANHVKLTIGYAEGDDKLSLIDPSVDGNSVANLIFSHDGSFTIGGMGSSDIIRYRFVNAPISSACTTVGTFPTFDTSNGGDRNKCSEGPFSIIDLNGVPLSLNAVNRQVSFTNATSDRALLFNLAPDGLSLRLDDMYSKLLGSFNIFTFISKDSYPSNFADFELITAFQADNTLILENRHFSVNAKLAIPPPAAPTVTKLNCKKGSFPIFPFQYATNGARCSESNDSLAIYFDDGFSFVKRNGTLLSLSYTTGASDSPATFSIGPDGTSLLSSIENIKYIVGFTKTEHSSLSLIKLAEVEENFTVAKVVLSPDNTFFLQEPVTGQFVSSNLTLGTAEAFKFISRVE